MAGSCFRGVAEKDERGLWLTSAENDRNCRGERFPKSARLLDRHDFTFKPYRLYKSECFKFVYNPRGNGRLGISISKKVLATAVARNRVRRLLREAFRKRQFRFEGLDIHVIGLPKLKEKWSLFTEADVLESFEEFLHESSH